jgi:hypothetical protein
MRSDVKAELQFGRELAWKYLYYKTCYFCQCWLVNAPGELGPPIVDQPTLGHRRHTQFPQEVTQHHIDENRENNTPGNIADCHSSCHKSYHNKKRAALRKEIINRYEGQETQNKENPEAEKIAQTEEIQPPGSLLK